MNIIVHKTINFLENSETSAVLHYASILFMYFLTTFLAELR